MEILVAVILVVEKDFQSFVPLFMQHLLTEMQSQDFNTRKMSIDVVSTIAKIVPIALKPYKKTLSEVLNELRFDKIKPVREACLECISAFKDVPDMEVQEFAKQKSLKGTKDK